MKKLMLIFGLVLVGVVGYFLTMPRCEQPEKEMMDQAKLECVLSINVPAVKEEACQRIYKSAAPCQFQDADKPVIVEILAKQVDDCAKAKLKKANKCIDKYEGIR